jgi:hypothetical protein
MTDMDSARRRPTVEELFELLKRTTLPTILVEGKDDIIFYRKIEEALSNYHVDVLPAGNKQSVLKLMELLKGYQSAAQFVYVVDKDLWVHQAPEGLEAEVNLITTDGYSIENDLFWDGELEGLLHKGERAIFMAEIEKFCEWYALAVQRTLSGEEGSFRTHPGKILDDPDFFKSATERKEGESAPTELYQLLTANYKTLLRGKSLIAILHRQLCKDGRDVKFSGKQLMAFGGARQGEKFHRLKSLIEKAFA